ncbi:DUF2892 domain-containing protein [Porphyromonadaceae sp. NP-X]|jgi:hypothetical protein|nr:DUF2892 domain-containing protein [Porphyromonadaceae sp. NP-X]
MKARSKKSLFRWNPVRTIQLIMGIVLLIAFAYSLEVLYLIVGGFLLLMALLNFSPCGKSCEVSTDNNDNK